MSAKVEIGCFKCGTTFEAKGEHFPLMDEGGFEFTAICPECKFDCGTIKVSLFILKK